MRGQGFSSCLICKDDSGLKHNSELLQEIIKTCYNTDEYELMISMTKVCFGCIGRLHQLHNFWTSKEANKDTVVENEMTCRFCFALCAENALLDASLQNDFRMMLEKTEIADLYPLSEHLTCCFSCTNFLQMWTQYKEILKDCKRIFLRIIGGCRVVISNQVKQEHPDITNVINESSVDEISDNSINNLTVMPSLPINLIEIPFTLPDELMQTPPSDALNQSLENMPAESQPVKDLSVIIQKLPSDKIVNFKDHLFENIGLTPVNSQRRGRSLSRLNNQLQNINENIVSRGRRSLRENSVPSKITDYENSGKIQTPRGRVSTSSTPTTRKRARRSKDTSNPPSKKPRIIESQGSDSAIMAFYNILPCAVYIEPLAIAPKNETRGNSTKKRGRKNVALKVKVASTIKKIKEPKNKDTPKKKKTRPTVFPLPLVCKEEQKDASEQVVQNLSNGMSKSTKNPDALVVTEELPASLVISEDFCEELFENLPQNGNVLSSSEDFGLLAIDHEEIIENTDFDDNSQYAHVSTEIEFLHPTHRERDDFQLAKEKDSAFKINESDETIPLLPPMEGVNQFGFDTAALKGNELISGYEKLATLNTQTGVAFLKDIDATVTAEDLAVMMQTVNDTNNNDNQTLP